MPNAQDVRKKRHISLIFRVAVAFGAILWVFHGQDWGELAEVFRRLNPWYFGLILAVFVVAQVIIAVRWWLLLRAQAIHVAVAMAVRLYFLGLFYNNVMPGAVGGDLLKAWYIAKHTNKRFVGVLSVFVDRFIGLFGLVLMAFFTWWLYVRGRPIGSAAAEPAAGPAAEPNWLSQHWGLILCLGLGAVATVALVWFHPFGRAKLQLAAGRAGTKAAGLLREVRDAVAVYCAKPWTLLSALLLTFVSQSTVILAFWLLGLNLGIDAGPRYYFVIFPFMWVVAAVPISIAGIGVFEAGTVGMFTLLTGAVTEKALALAFCQRFVWVLASLPGGLIHLLGAHLPREISVDDEEGLS